MAKYRKKPAPRLIDADALLEKEFFVDDEDGFGCSAVISADIRRAPTIDPESLRPHGRWFEMVDLVEDGHTGEYFEELFYNCTNCDCVSEQKTPFCPWCGATMDLEE